MYKIITPEMCQELFNTMEDRMGAVIKAKGRCYKILINCFYSSKIDTFLFRYEIQVYISYSELEHYQNDLTLRLFTYNLLRAISIELPFNKMENISNADVCFY